MSEWKEGAAKRRDFRHTHNGPDTIKRGKKKNTKRWCKGIVGREHEIVHGPSPQYPNWYHADYCKKCSKEVKTYWKRMNIISSNVVRTVCKVCRKPFE